MNITWYGHAAFGISGTNLDGKPVRIILDPYNYPECGGYLPIDEEADIVSISHENRRYHSDTSAILGDFQLFNGLDYAGSTRTGCGVEFSAHQVYESPAGDGPNTLVKFQLEEMTVAHLGDLGHPLDPVGCQFLEDCDILLALAGGPPTIALPDLRELIKSVRPHLVIPMHYKTPKVNLNLLSLEAFLVAFAGFPVEKIGSSSLAVTRATLPKPVTLCTLQHAR